MNDKSSSITDDKLITPEIGAWGKEKYKLVGLYAQLFSQSMQGKWQKRVYIDLFSGAGRSRIRDTNEIVLASPLIALGISTPFDEYIFCEADTEKCAALRSRVQRDFTDRKVTIIEGDANKSVDQIIGAMPKYSKTSKVLAFCFADPYKLSNLSFETIQKLSERFMDFLVLVPTYMDANRNIANYLKADDNTFANFFGESNWRDLWSEVSKKGGKLDRFMLDLYARKMKELKYIDPGADSTVLIRSDEKNLPLYRLVLYSRHSLGSKFWKEAKKYSKDQISFDF